MGRHTTGSREHRYDIDDAGLSGILATGNLSPKNRVGDTYRRVGVHRIAGSAPRPNTPIRPNADPRLPLADTPTRLSTLLCFNFLEDINDLRGFFGGPELIAQFVVAKNAHQGTDQA